MDWWVLVPVPDLCPPFSGHHSIFFVSCENEVVEKLLSAFGHGFLDASKMLCSK
jgi:hypothetical protein